MIRYTRFEIHIGTKVNPQRMSVIRQTDYTHVAPEDQSCSSSAYPLATDIAQLRFSHSFLQHVN